MRYKARAISLKNGQKAIIKSPEEINAKEIKKQLTYIKAKDLRTMD